MNSVTEPVVFYGSLINPQSLLSLNVLPRCLLAVNKSGNIDWIIEDVDNFMVQSVLREKGLSDVKLIKLKIGEFIMPGFVDTHTHAPQVPNMGRGQQYELLDWLDNITFPTESKFSDVNFAKSIYPSVVRRIIDSGTTTCCYYGSIHLDSTQALVDIVLNQGQRALIGKCNMDRNCPDHYRESSPEISIADTKKLISYIRSRNSNLIHPVLTPRFAISCTSSLLSALGEMKKTDPSLAIQTHISENKNEISFTQELFPESKSYADVYDMHGLLTENTILAHAVHLEEDEMQLISARKSGISHCPTSNFNLRSGMARVGKMLDNNIKVGLGTDVSGGYSPSILTAIRNASICSKMIAVQSTSTTAIGASFDNKQLPVSTLFYLATMGGAQVCSLSHSIGSLEQGKSFDALLVTIRPESGNPAVWVLENDLSTLDKNKLESFLEKFLFCGDDRNISRVYVQGRLIGGHTTRASLQTD